MSLTIYKASAGSGKTFTLSATYIAHLLSDDDDFPHKHQLAVTFTNKATAEMKERILQYLYSIANGNDDTDGFFLAVRKMVPERITNKMLRQRARRTLSGIIHDYDHFHVTTIDSFFQSLLSSLAHELNLSASFKVEIGDKEVLARAVDRLLENVKEGSDELGWITEYIQERMNDDKNWNVAEELKELAKQITKESYMLNSHLLNRSEDSEDPEAINLDNKVLSAYKRVLKEVMTSQRKAVAEKAAEVHDCINNGLTYKNISNGTRYVESTILQLAAPNHPLNNIKFSPTFCGYADGSKDMLKSADRDNEHMKNMAEEVKMQLTELISLYNESIPVYNSCRLSLANLNPLRLLDKIDKEVSELNKENDSVLLAYTPLLFHKLSADTDASFVFERAGTQFQHIMIDEFQDTSKLQWENMRRLLIEDMAQGNSCMLVGDVKQGIYRFRGGDWNALASFEEGYDGDLHSYINIKTLDTNFRSGRVVVEFNNMLFTHAPSVVQGKVENAWGENRSKSQCQDYDSQIHVDVSSIYPTPSSDDDHEVTQIPHLDGGFVRIEFLNNETEEEKKARKDAEKKAKAIAAESGEETNEDSFSREASVAEQMMMLHAEGVPYKEMAILIRGNNDAKPLMEYFEEQHGKNSPNPIDLISEEAFLLEASPAVMTIVNALRYVSNPTNGIAWEYLRRHCPKGKNAEEIKEMLDTWNREKYSGLPFYEASCRLAEIFCLHEQEGQSPYMYCFLDAVLTYIDDHSADVDDFLQHWEETLHKKAIPSAAVDGVRILTIHKSKGLAFHSVFIPYCDWEIEKHAELLWVRPSQSPYNNIPILPIKMTKEAGNSIYSDTYKQEMFDKYVENLNLLYVAFTRTRQNLLVWADCAKNGISTILHDALQPEEASQPREDVMTWGSPSALYIAKEGAPAPDDKAETNNMSGNPLEYKTTPIHINFSQYAPKLVFRQSNNALQFLNPEPADDDAQSTSAQEEYRQTGILLHNLMSSIENRGDADAKIDEAARKGELPLSISKERIKALITKRMSHPKSKLWFDGSWQLYRECEIVFRQDGKTVTRRPDRVMTRGNLSDATDETIVIDFKFGKYKAEHTEQVKEYMNLLKQQGRHSVKGYLWYLYSGSIEEVE